MYQESEYAVWRRWAVWSFLGFINWGGYSGAILLGWAGGNVFGAGMIVFRRAC